MARLRYNFTFGTVLDNPLTIGATVLNSFALAAVPTITAPDYIALTIDPAEVHGDAEIVYLTAHTSGNNFGTITRAQEGSAARAHVTAEQWHNGPTAFDFNYQSLIPDLVTTLGSDFTGYQRKADVILSGSFLPTTTTAALAVAGSLTSSGPSSVPISCYVGTPAPPLHTGAASSAVAGVSVSTVGKAGGADGTAVNIARTLALSGLTPGVRMYWEIRYGILGATNVVAMTKQPSAIVLTPDGTKGYVATLMASSPCQVYPLWTGRSAANSSDVLASPITLGGTAGVTKLGLAASPDGARVFVANSSAAAVQVISTFSDTVTATVSLAALQNTVTNTTTTFSPQGVVISPDSATAWVIATYATSGSGSVIIRINQANTTTPVVASVLATTNPGDNLFSYALALSPDGTRAVVSSQAGSGHGQITVVNTSGSGIPSVVAKVDAGAQFPCQAGFEPGGTGAWIPLTDTGQVKRFNVSAPSWDGTATVLTAVTYPTAVAVTADGTSAVVTGATAGAGGQITYSLTTIAGATHVGVVWASQALGAPLITSLPPGPTASLALSADGFIYLAQPAAVTNQIYCMHGGQLWCRAGTDAAALASARLGEYLTVSVFGGH